MTTGIRLTLRGPNPNMPVSAITTRGPAGPRATPGARMAVRGIGIDIVKVDRIRESLERFGHRMESRLFTAAELDYCRGHKDPLPHLAARFAAKEAASKALGTGMSGGVAFKHIEVLQPGGRVPTLRFHDVALQRYESMACTASHLSLTHDGGLAVACVVLEG